MEKLTTEAEDLLIKFLEWNVLYAWADGKVTGPGLAPVDEVLFTELDGKGFLWMAGGNPLYTLYTPTKRANNYTFIL